MTINIKGYDVLIDDEDYKRVMAAGPWHKVGTTMERPGIYFSHGITRSKHIRLHRFIMNCPENMVVDHINGDTLDNRKENLRICTSDENKRNQKKYKNNTSGYKGVSYHKHMKKWKAEIVINNKHVYLGLHNTPEEAHAAYCEAAKEYHGDFRRLA